MGTGVIFLCNVGFPENDTAVGIEEDGPVRRMFSAWCGYYSGVSASAGSEASSAGFAESCSGDGSVIRPCMRA